MSNKVLWDWTYCLLSLSEKTRKSSDHLQMSLQGQQILNFHLSSHVSFAKYLPPPSLMFNIELDSCLDPNRPAPLSDSMELPLSIKLIVSWTGFFIFFGSVSDARLRSIPDLLNLAPRCFCFSVANRKKNQKSLLKCCSFHKLHLQVYLHNYGAPFHMSTIIFFHFYCRAVIQW